MEIVSTFQERIQEAQKGDEELEEIRVRISEGKTKEFRLDEQVSMGSVCAFPMTPISGRRFYKKLMIRHTQFIQVTRRCT